MAQPATESRRYTYADCCSWPDDERLELIDGEEYAISPAQTRIHQDVVIELVVQIHRALKDTSCRVYIAPFDVRLPDRDRDGVADGIEPVAARLNAPSSIAFFRDGSLYVGETARILRLSAPGTDGAFGQPSTVVDGLPARRGHSTRTVLFGTDWQWLYERWGEENPVRKDAYEEYVKVQFGADNAWATALVLDQPLFQAQAFIGVGAAARYKGLQEEVLRGRAQNLVTRVRLGYYGLLLAQENLRLISESVDRVRQSLEETQALNRAGIASDYDVLRLDDARTAVLVADVSGKGMSASLVAASLDALLVGPIEVGHPTDAICARVGRRLNARTPPERYATAIIASLDPKTGVLAYTNAGHNAGLLIRAG